MNNNELRKEHNLLVRKYFNHTIRTLVRVIDSKHRFTRGHSYKVVKFCAKITAILRLKKDEVLKIKIAALLHDIGKFRIDRSILNKQGKLTEKEWREVKKHPIVGARIIKETGILDEIVNIVKHHHERFGGGGYPDPYIKGENIPLGARIICVADAYDAMTSDRPYRKRPMTKQEAVNELKCCAGAQFDPRVVSALVRTI